MPGGFGFWLWWLTAPYWYPYMYYWWWRCRWFPWLPRLWWTGIYGPITPFTAMPYLPREQEIAVLEDQKRLIEEELSWISKRLEELKKEEVTQG